MNKPTASPPTNSDYWLNHQLIDTHETARRLNLSRHTLIRWRTTGQGPAFLKFGRRVLYDPAVLSEWVRRQTRSSTAED